MTWKIDNYTTDNIRVDNDPTSKFYIQHRLLGNPSKLSVILHYTGFVIATTITVVFLWFVLKTLYLKQEYGLLLTFLVVMPSSLGTCCWVAYKIAKDYERDIKQIAYWRFTQNNPAYLPFLEEIKSYGNLSTEEIIKKFCDFNNELYQKTHQKTGE